MNTIMASRDTHNNENRYVIEGQREIPTGSCQITVDVVLDSEERGSAGTVEILVNGEPQALGRIEKTVRPGKNRGRSCINALFA